MKLARYVARRLLLLVPVLLGVSLVTFVLVRVLPGDPVRTVMPQTATPADIAAARVRYGLDRPIIVQYWIWLKGLLHGRLGNSFQTGVDIRTEFLQRIGPTFELITLALIVALVIAIPLGVFAALRAGKGTDHAIRLGAISFGAVSEFWLGLLLILFFYADLHLAPPPERADRLRDPAPQHHVHGARRLDDHRERQSLLLRIRARRPPGGHAGAGLVGAD